MPDDLKVWAFRWFCQADRFRRADLLFVFSLENIGFWQRATIVINLVPTLSDWAW